MNNEDVIFEQKGVRITKSMIDIRGNSYPVRNITSIRVKTITPSQLGPFVTFIFGSFVSLMSFVICAPAILDPNAGSNSISMFVPILFAAGPITCFTGLRWGSSLKPQYALVFGTSGNESQALIDLDRDFVDATLRAIHEALRSSVL